MGIAQVEDFKRSAIFRLRHALQSRQYSSHNVVDESVVAAGGTISEDRQWLSRFHQVSKFVNGQVRPLSGPVNREEAQADHRQGEEMRVGIAEHFSGEFGRSIRRNGPEVHLILRERSFGGRSIHRTRGSKQEFFHAEFAT